MSKSKTKSAFTLIELLVVIAIIGVLATISVIALSNARAKARDAKRIADTKQISTALEMFFNDNNRYPTDAEFASGSLVSTSSGLTVTYMSNIPTAPTPHDGDCTSDQNAFVYKQTENGGAYTLDFCLGNSTGSLAAGLKSFSPGGIINGSSADIPRMADIRVIEAAMNAMYSAHGSYFFDSGGYRYDRGRSLVDGSERQTNCSTVTSQPGDTGSSKYGSSVPCPTLSNWCLKWNVVPNDYTYSAGTACDSGDVYLRNIPLNNHLAVGVWAQGVHPYTIYVSNGFDGNGNDFFEMKYHLSGDAPKDHQSDHFVTTGETEAVKPRRRA